MRAFFGGVWQGLKDGLAPVIEKFKPLGDLFGIVVGWIEKAVKWFSDLLSPVENTTVELLAASRAGRNFGEWLAAGIDLVTKPLQWVMDSIKWIMDNIPTIEKTADAIMPQQHRQQIQKTAALAYADPTGGMITDNIASTKEIPLVKKWSGGYAGNGGKYEPKGIYHGGEYIMTKAATSRLGVPLLNALNYGKNALLATGIGMSVATAAPLQVDTRPPLSAKAATVQPLQPMTVNITINAAQGQDERAIARMIAQEMQRLQNQQQARLRSRLGDRE